MGLSASQGRLLLLTARKSDLEFQAQQISHKRLLLAQQLNAIASEYEEAVSNKQMTLKVFEHGDGKADSGQVNLSYAALVSGAVCSEAFSKYSDIRKSKAAGTDGLTQWSQNAYRLVDPSGNIVVSSLDEIPSESSKQVCCYRDTSYSGSGETALKKALNGATEALVATFQGTNGMVTMIKIDNKYYEVGSGYEQTTSANGERAKSINSWTRMELATYSSGKFRSTGLQDKKEFTVSDEGNGKYWVRNESTGETHTYVVDKALQGGLHEPNYLQDCIRNGKYGIQQLLKSEEPQETYNWTDMAWESTTAIHDQYWQDDDAAAQAKYDNLQAEIQTEDKKLEMELNNIETQRTAVATEIESVQKVIKDNVDGSFKIFS